MFAPPTTTPPPPPLVSGEGFDIGALGGWSLALPEEGRVVPTFDSYAVCRRYTAALTVRVMCAEKVFVARFKWAPVVVLAAGAESEDEDAVGELGKVEAVEGFWVGDAVEVGGQLLTGIMGVVGAFG